MLMSVTATLVRMRGHAYMTLTCLSAFVKMDMKEQHVKQVKQLIGYVHNVDINGCHYQLHCVSCVYVNMIHPKFIYIFLIYSGLRF